MSCLVSFAKIAICVAEMEGSTFSAYDGSELVATWQGTQHEIPCVKDRAVLQIVGVDESGAVVSDAPTPEFFCIPEANGADLNGDGVVGLSDFAVFGEVFGCEVVRRECG